jgi:hypothetical protein
VLADVNATPVSSVCLNSEICFHLSRALVELTANATSSRANANRAAIDDDDDDNEDEEATQATHKKEGRRVVQYRGGMTNQLESSIEFSQSVE